MKAEDVMTTKVITVTEHQSKQQAAHLLLQHRISGLPVVNADHVVVGMVSDKRDSTLANAGIVEQPASGGTTRDANANDMTDSFDFSQTPLPPLILNQRSCPLVDPSLYVGGQSVGKKSGASVLYLTNNTSKTLMVNSIVASPYFSQAASTSLRALQEAGRGGRLPKIGIHPRNVYMQNEPLFLPRIENPPKIHAMRRGGARLCPSPPAENI